MSLRTILTCLAVAVAVAVIISFGSGHRPSDPAAHAPEPGEARPASPSRPKEPLPSPLPRRLPPAPDEVRLTTAVTPGIPLYRSSPEAPPPAPDAPIVKSPAPTPNDPQSDLENVRLMFRDFRTRMGENPIGSNAEIMKAVMGNNPAHARLGPPEGQSLNGQGELVDRWGTPYFFHQLSKDSLEIRSAGPDARMWTVDDVVGR